MANGGRFRGWMALALATAAGMTAFAFPVGGRAGPPSAGATFTSANALVFPANYREWIYLSSGLGMTYRKPGEAPSHEPSFDNVFVNPEAYREFSRLGRWPDGTIFALEVRASQTHGSINEGGRFQRKLMDVETHVKDARFPGGWAFFAFEAAGGSPPPAPALPRSAACYGCHGEHGAVEETFVQFYPTLLPIASARRTLRPGFDTVTFDQGAPNP